MLCAEACQLEGKQTGTIVIPVFIDETEEADHALSKSAFEPVWLSRSWFGRMPTKRRQVTGRIGDPGK